MSYVERRRQEILAEREKGKSLRELGRRFGISGQRVHAIASEPAPTRIVPATPATLRHIARSLRAGFMPNFAATIDDAADQLERTKVKQRRT